MTSISSGMDPQNGDGDRAFVGRTVEVDRQRGPADPDDGRGDPSTRRRCGPPCRASHRPRRSPAPASAPRPRVMSLTSRDRLLTGDQRYIGAEGPRDLAACPRRCPPRQRWSRRPAPRAAGLPSGPSPPAPITTAVDPGPEQRQRALHGVITRQSRVGQWRRLARVEVPPAESG